MNSAYPTTTEASNTAAINQAASDNAVAAAVGTRQPTIGPQEFTVEPITQAQRDPLPPFRRAVCMSTRFRLHKNHKQCPCCGFCCRW